MGPEGSLVVGAREGRSPRSPREKEIVGDYDALARGEKELARTEGLMGETAADSGTRSRRLDAFRCQALA